MFDAITQIVTNDIINSVISIFKSAGVFLIQKGSAVLGDPGYTNCYTDQCLPNDPVSKIITDTLLIALTRLCNRNKVNKTTIKKTYGIMLTYIW